MSRRPPRSALFPSTPLFRSVSWWRGSASPPALPGSAGRDVASSRARRSREGSPCPGRAWTRERRVFFYWERGAEGKRGEDGGGRVILKKKKRTMTETAYVIH